MMMMMMMKMFVLLLVSLHVHLTWGHVSTEVVPKLTTEEKMCRAAGNEDTLKNLLSDNPTFNVNDKICRFGNTLLIRAASHLYTNNLEVVNFLLSVPGIDVNIQHGFGYSAIMWATLFGREEIVERLMKAGADASLESMDGNTACDIAEEKINSEAVRDKETYENILTKKYTAILNKLDGCKEPSLFGHIVSQYNVAMDDSISVTDSVIKGRVAAKHSVEAFQTEIGLDLPKSVDTDNVKYENSVFTTTATLSSVTIAYGHLAVADPTISPVYGQPDSSVTYIPTSAGLDKITTSEDHLKAQFSIEFGKLRALSRNMAEWAKSDSDSATSDGVFHGKINNPADVVTGEILRQIVVPKAALEFAKTLNPTTRQPDNEFKRPIVLFQLNCNQLSGLYYHTFYTREEEGDELEEYGIIDPDTQPIFVFTVFGDEMTGKCNVETSGYSETFERFNRYILWNYTGTDLTFKQNTIIHGSILAPEAWISTAPKSVCTFYGQVIAKTLFVRNGATVQVEWEPLVDGGKIPDYTSDSTETHDAAAPSTSFKTMSS